MSDLSDQLKNVYESGETGRWETFLKRSIYLVLFSLILLVLERNGLKISEQLQISLRRLLALSILLIPQLINTATFVWARYPWFGIRFSNKINVVFAYNLQGVYEEKYKTKLDAIINQIRNEIDRYDLGKKLVLRIAPSDIRFKEKTAAEANVKLGLRGSTLLVWGDVTKERGQTNFFTRFSYEFCHPKSISKDIAKKAFNEYLTGIMNRGLFKGPVTNSSVIKKQLTPTVLFILGLTTMTVGYFDKAEKFFLAFKEYYENVDLMRKRDLGPAWVECNSMLVQCYRFRTPMISVDSDPSSILEAEKYARLILNLDNKDYVANIILAMIFEMRGDRSKAKEHNINAKNCAPIGEVSYIFNDAYFAICDSHYKEAVDYFDSINNADGRIVGYVVRYLDRKYQQTRDPALLFAEGYVQNRWWDKKRSKKLLKLFLAKAEPTMHNDLILRATGILSR